MLTDGVKFNILKILYNLFESVSGATLGYYHTKLEINTINVKLMKVLMFFLLAKVV